MSLIFLIYAEVSFIDYCLNSTKYMSTLWCWGYVSLILHLCVSPLRTHFIAVHLYKIQPITDGKVTCL